MHLFTIMTSDFRELLVLVFLDMDHCFSKKKNDMDH